MIIVYNSDLGNAKKQAKQYKNASFLDENFFDGRCKKGLKVVLCYDVQKPERFKGFDIVNTTIKETPKQPAKKKEGVKILVDPDLEKLKSGHKFCKFCGKEFKPTNSLQLYCSKKCKDDNADMRKASKKKAK